MARSSAAGARKTSPGRKRGGARGSTNRGAPVNGSAAAEVRAGSTRAKPEGTGAADRVPIDPARCIRVRGAREHNLKNIDVDIPRDRLVVITGLSGSGKSSLAFDTIFAEGQRKYMESLSAYARQFLDQLKKPDVDDIEGLPPTIAIEQRSGVSNPRSTVATSTEIYDYLRLLFARCGTPHCWAPVKTRKNGEVVQRCGRRIESSSASQIVAAIMTGVPGTRLLVLGPVVSGKKGFHKDVLEDLQRQGWARVRVNGKVIDLRDALKEGGENPLGLGRFERHSIEVVVDRIVLSDEARQRLAESVEAALRVGDGTVIISIEQDAAAASSPAKNPKRKRGSARAPEPSTEPVATIWVDQVYSEKFACPDHPEAALEELSPRLFSFNSPHGACPTCHGLGMILEFDEDLVIPDRSKSLEGGAIKPWKVPPPMGRIFRRKIRHFCQDFGVNPRTPVEDLEDWVIEILLRGTTPADEREFGAKFNGVFESLHQWYQRTESSFMKEWLGQYMEEVVCPECRGDRLRISALHVLLRSGHKADKARALTGSLVARPAADATWLNIADLSRLTITDARAWIEGLILTEEQRTIAEPIVREVLNRLGFLESVGLEYLSLDRKTGTLSGGEAQRIRLATQVGSKLVGACYVLDEPTIGLHQRDNARLIRTLRHLADIGNTVIVVEHDEDMIRSADWVLDMGPGPGVHGGRPVAMGTVEELIEQGTKGQKERGTQEERSRCSDERWSGSLTALYLSGQRSIEIPKKRRPLDEKNAIVVKSARENNLKSIDACFPLGGMICVTGVSGSGKSTLVNDILLKAIKQHLHGSRARPGAHARINGLNRLDRIIEVDQSPIGRTPRSNPATYTGIFDEIRKIFAATKEAKIRGYKPGRFSFNVKAKNGGGRCEACEGQGLKKIEMHFLPDVYVECEVCRGKRYNRETLEVLYRGRSIADVLAMTIEDACDFFENHPKILRFVQCLRDVGLEYVELGQPSTTLSGGEAQRVKLATELGKTNAAYELAHKTANGTGAADEGEDDSVDDAAARNGNGRGRTGGAATGHTLYILDEPTTGLHFEDVRKLVGVLNRLADAGNTLVVIEHNLDVIKCADWLIDLGPEGGDRGGQIVASGPPEAVARTKGSHTGEFLAPMLL